MKVELVSYTQPVKRLIDAGIETAEDLIAFCARVSNPSNQLNSQTSRKLISFLIKNKHWSPLEMVDMTLEIECTRDIGRQILRHWSFSFQEFSQRYAKPTDLGFEKSEVRLQDIKDRQNSVQVDDDILGAWWDNSQDWVIGAAQEIYAEAIRRGVAKELARKVLPEGLTLSRMYMKGSLRDWVHYISLRRSHGTQKEHKLIALECAKVISIAFPITDFLTES